MSEESRLRWQCRRGMRELDDHEKAAFETVLQLADPELNGYLLQRQTPASEPIARVIKHILS